MNRPLLANSEPYLRLRAVTDHFRNANVKVQKYYN